jgi:chromosome segregation ATPase
MAESELENAFTTLTEALTLTETEVSEEIKVIEQQISEMKNRITELSGRQDVLAHDRQSIAEMFERYVYNTGETGT